MMAALASAYKRAVSLITAADTPQISATTSGGYSRTRSHNSSNPMQLEVTKSRS